jgi:peptide/nickel transport system permease protein
MIAAIFLSTWALLSRLLRTRREEELGRAVTAGAGRARLLARHILPNILGDALGFLTLTGADMVMLMTGLSFVGIGMGTDIIDWGAMIADGRAGMTQNPLLVWAPAAGIFLMTFSLYALGERIGPGRDL